MKTQRAAMWGSGALALALAAAAARAELPALTPVTDVPLPGRSAPFGSQSFDPVTKAIYIAHTGEGALLAFNTESRTVFARLAGFPGVTGVLAIPELHRVFATAPGRREVVVIDADALKVVARIPAGDSPDGLAYAPEAGKLFVSDARGGKVTVIDAKTHRRLGVVEVGGEVGGTQYEPRSKRILATVKTRNELVVIDPETETIVGRHGLSGANAPRGLAVAVAKRLAFVACEGNAKLLVVDLETFQVQYVLPTGEGPDVLAFDPGLERLYVASGSGVVSVFQLGRRALSRMEDVFVAKGSHTICVNPDNHLVHLPIEDVGGRPVLRIMKPRMP